VSTTTDDAEGELVGEADASAIPRAEIDRGIAALTGVISQVPSTYSAIKVNGRRSYDLARSGAPVELAARTVTIAAFEVLAERREKTYLDLDVRISCTSGTYIRALARDLGAGLAVGGHLTALRRTRVGPFRIEDAVADPEALPGALRSPASIAAELFPTTTLDAEQLRDLTHGKRVELAVPDTEILAALSAEGRLAGLIAVKKGTARVLVNFPTSEVLE
jgi:tRNA pseudouridine55 synthase